ncbi:MAG: pyrroline-5-carboxylate reductase [Bacteroidia bacterium]
MKSLAVIGTGNLGIAIIEGILNNHFLPAQNIYATRNKLERIEFLKEKGVNTTQDNIFAVEQAEVIILALKPFKILEILEEIKPALTSAKVVISVASSISLSSMQAVIGKDISLFRAMPNTAASTEESMTCICGHSNQPEHKQIAQDIFNHIGESIFIQEELMNAATVIGACGIAYVLRFIRAMIQGGIEIGFDATTATKIVTQTVKGASELLIQTGNHPEQEIDKVTTPKGCTIAGLNEMEHQGFSSALIKGIKTSYTNLK